MKVESLIHLLENYDPNLDIVVDILKPYVRRKCCDHFEIEGICKQKGFDEYLGQIVDKLVIVLE